MDFLILSRTDSLRSEFLNKISLGSTVCLLHLLGNSEIVHFCPEASTGFFFLFEGAENFQSEA